MFQHQTCGGASDMLVRVAEIPRGDSIDIRGSSFFKSGGRDLPSPTEVREEGIRVNARLARSSRPPPVVLKEQGLLVKYGPEITIAEAQCLWFFNRHMRGKVPTPELFGWRRDGAETFIYMELVQGQTLEERWPSLDDEERKLICREMKECVKAWRGLRQETEPYYIGKRSEVL